MKPLKLLLVVALIAALYGGALYVIRHHADGQTPNGLGG